MNRLPFVIPFLIYTLHDILLFERVSEFPYREIKRIMSNVCEVLATDEFRDWYYELDNIDADKVFQIIGMLEAAGVTLKFPYSSHIEGSKYPLRELRVPTSADFVRFRS
jgi:hypothetical protein